jgi:hypothetical protein
MHWKYQFVSIIFYSMFWCFKIPSSGNSAWNLSRHWATVSAGANRTPWRWRLVGVKYCANTVDPRVTTGLTYEQLGLRPKILVLTYDQSLELRPACQSRPLELRPAWHSQGSVWAQIRMFVDVFPVSALLYIINFANFYQNGPKKARK